jgi:hypothetical protein
MLRPTVSQPVCLGIKHPSGLTIRFLLLSDSCAFVDVARGRICRLQLLLALARAVIFGSGSHGTRDHILLSQVRDIPFRRLLRLAVLRSRYSTPPPYGTNLTVRVRVRTRSVKSYILGADQRENTASNSTSLVGRGPLPSNGCCLVSCFAVVA